MIHYKFHEQYKDHIVAYSDKPFKTKYGDDNDYHWDHLSNVHRPYFLIIFKSNVIKEMWELFCLNI